MSARKSMRKTPLELSAELLATKARPPTEIRWAPDALTIETWAPGEGGALKHVAVTFFQGRDEEHFVDGRRVSRDHPLVAGLIAKKESCFPSPNPGSPLPSPSPLQGEIESAHVTIREKLPSPSWERARYEEAARAAGYALWWKEGHCKGGDFLAPFIGDRPWRPEEDDGDAMRLAVDAHIDFARHTNVARAVAIDVLGRRVVASIEEPCGDDPRAAARRAIFWAAVAIGEATKQVKVALSADVEDLRDRLVAISEEVAAGNDVTAQAMLRETLRLLSEETK